jgi:hypothetical protein
MVPVPQSSPVVSLALRRRLRRLGAVDGQIDDEARPLPFGRLGEDEAARLLDDAVDGREPEAGALADLLGGEERLEDLGEEVRRDAGAGVGDPQRGIVGDRQDLAAHPAHVFGRDGIGLDGEEAAAHRVLGEHRVAAVDGEVDDDLLELARIRTNRTQGTAVLDLELDGLAEQAAQQGRHFGDDVGELENLGAQGLLPRNARSCGSGRRRGSSWSGSAGCRHSRCRRGCGASA